MKYLKMLGLAAVAAMALTAFLGAGSASATVLCKTTLTEGCAASGWDYSGTLDASLVGTAILETTSAENPVTLDTCTGGAVNGTASTGGASSTVEGSVSAANLTWTGCSKTTDTIEGGTLIVHHIAGTDNGTVTVKNFTVTVNTIFGTCTFGWGATEAHLGTLTGSHTTPIIDINVVVPRKSGICPESRWTASYHITKPEGALFVSAS